MTRPEETSLKPALEDVARLYDDNLRQHGRTSRSVGWSDPAEHKARFERLLAVIKPHDLVSGFTINDLGTGYGALLDHLRDAGVAMTGFFGYDISSEMLGEAAREVDGVETAWIEAARPTRIADYTIACGIFNVRFAADESAWRQYMEETILEMAAKSRKGFAFNGLTTQVDWREPHLFYADPAHFLSFCLKHCSRFVTLRHDSRLYEWTITVHMEPNP